MAGWGTGIKCLATCCKTRKQKSSALSAGKCSPYCKPDQTKPYTCGNIFGTALICKKWGLRKTPPYRRINAKKAFMEFDSERKNNNLSNEPIFMWLRDEFHFPLKHQLLSTRTERIMNSCGRKRRTLLVSTDASGVSERSLAQNDATPHASKVLTMNSRIFPKA